MTPLSFDLVVDDPRWDAINLETICEAACGALALELQLNGDFEFCILACDDVKILELNETFRGKPQATNVLSWPSTELGAVNEGEVPQKPSESELGDIAISYDTCCSEAATSGLEIHHHVTHLVIHGVLHLLGYDHVRDADATLMESIEISTLERLTIANPY